MHIFQPLAVITQDEAGFFNASSPHVAGAFSYGRTLDEAIAGMREAIEGVIETALEEGYAGVLSAREYEGEAGQAVAAIDIEPRLRVAATIHLARERAGLNQAEFARRAGLNRETISRYERGKRMPAADKFLKLVETV